MSEVAVSIAAPRLTVGGREGCTAAAGVYLAGACCIATPEGGRILLVQAQPADADDQTSGYMLQAGARICKSLGEEFLPYLGIVMPPLLHSAELKPDVRVTDADSDDDDDDNDEDVSNTSFLLLRHLLMQPTLSASCLICP